MSRDRPRHDHPDVRQGLRYGRAGAQPAPTTRPLGPRYDRRGAQGRGHGAQGTASRGAHVTSPRYGVGPATRPALGYNTAKVSATIRRWPGHDTAMRARLVRVGWACWLGQLGQVGALYTCLSSDSVFEPV